MEPFPQWVKYIRIRGADTSQMSPSRYLFKKDNLDIWDIWDIWDIELETFEIFETW